jgi:surfactin synthase thioesterase subunit
LHCPIRAFGGVADTSVTRDNLEAWAQHTTGGATASLLPGDHFFINTATDDLLYRLAADLRDQGI